MSLQIKGFIETSLIDWDGKIVSVIFLPGCNYRCGFCHNMGIITHPETYKTFEESTILDYLNSHKDFVDGVCITGGEPSLHKNNVLMEFIKNVKEKGFLVKMDTNGSDADFIKELQTKKLVDFFAMDIKAPYENYSLAANMKVDIAPVKESIKLIMNGDIDYEFRTTLVPSLIDIADIEKIAEYIKGAKKFVLQQFEPENCPDIEMKKLKPYEKDVIDKMIEVAKKYVGNVIYRGK